jgi:hypothetical protein
LVERVKITPSQILLKDGDGNIKFNTDYAYLKTGSGTLYAGGYDRAPAIYGQNSVYDHTDSGGYCSGLFDGTFYATQNWNYYLNVPQAPNYQFRVVGAGRSLITGGFKSNNIRPVKYYNYDTKQLVDINTTFYWQIDQYGLVDGDGNYYSVQWEAYPVLSSNTLPSYGNPNGGTFEFTYTANEYANYSRTTSSYNPKTGQTTYNTQYGNQFFSERSSYNPKTGQTTTIPASPIYFRRSGIFSKRNPTALSLAVTP